MGERTVTTVGCGRRLTAALVACCVQIVCNGPGTCLPIIVAAWMFKVSTAQHSNTHCHSGSMSLRPLTRACHGVWCDRCGCSAPLASCSSRASAVSAVCHCAVAWCTGWWIGSLCSGRASRSSTTCRSTAVDCVDDLCTAASAIRCSNREQALSAALLFAVYRLLSHCRSEWCSCLDIFKDLLITVGR